LRLSERLARSIAGDPAGLAIDHDGADFTWGQAKSVAVAVEGALEDSGVAPGEQVALVARNRPAHVAAVWALFAAGRCVSMVHAFQAASRIAEDVQAMRRPLVLAAASDWTPEVVRAAEAAGSVGYALTDDDAEPLRRVTANATPGAAADRSRPDGIAVEILSSGTTGRPKRVPLTLRAVEEMVDRTLALYQQGGAKPDSASLMVWPISNISGINMILPPAAIGQALAIQERFEAAGFLAMIRRHRPSFLGVPPSVLAMLLQQNPSREDMASIRIASTGSAPIDPAVQARLESEYNIGVMCSYGATEFCGLVAGWVPDDMVKFARVKRGSVGRALPGISIRIVSPDGGAPLAANRSGLLEALVPRIGPDWIRTNDVAHLDDDGFLYLEGRADDAIIRGGFKILPEDVVVRLREHPAIADAAVMGWPDERLGAVPVAAFEVRAGQAAPGAEELSAFLRERLSAYQVPVRFVRVDRLPRTASMKISREGLRALFSQPAA
jgi:acyl-CoA synthetase (AMP-forming)/AMP-acid ligase II